MVPLAASFMEKTLSLQDAALVGRIRQSDSVAFQILFDHYWRRLYTTAYRKLRCHEDARDLVQELFVSLWVKRETLLVQESLDAYLFSALRYRIINYFSLQATRSLHREALGKLAAHAQDSTSNALYAEELNNALTEQVSRLPQRMREVFELSRTEGLSIREIADRLDLSDQTVKNQISSALKTLRLKLHHFFSYMLLLLHLL